MAKKKHSLGVDGDGALEEVLQTLHASKRRNLRPIVDVLREDPLRVRILAVLYCEHHRKTIAELKDALSADGRPTREMTGHFRVLQSLKLIDAKLAPRAQGYGYLATGKGRRCAMAIAQLSSGINGSLRELIDPIVRAVSEECENSVAAESSDAQPNKSTLHVDVTEPTQEGFLDDARFLMSLFVKAQKVVRGIRSPSEASGVFGRKLATPHMRRSQEAMDEVVRSFLEAAHLSDADGAALIRSILSKAPGTRSYEEHLLLNALSTFLDFQCMLKVSQAVRSLRPVNVSSATARSTESR